MRNSAIIPLSCSLTAEPLPPGTTPARTVVDPPAAVGLRAPPDPGRGQPAEPPREWSCEPYYFDDLPVPEPVMANRGPSGPGCLTEPCTPPKRTKAVHFVL